MQGRGTPEALKNLETMFWQNKTKNRIKINILLYIIVNYQELCYDIFRVRKSFPQMENKKASPMQREADTFGGDQATGNLSLSSVLVRNKHSTCIKKRDDLMKKGL